MKTILFFTELPHFTHDAGVSLTAALFVIAFLALCLLPKFWMDSDKKKNSLTDKEIAQIQHSQSLTKNKVRDAVNQVYQFRFATVQTAKELIQEASLKTLEEYTGETRQTLEAECPGACDTYNALIEELRKGNFTQERLKGIAREAWEITHPD